MSVNAQWVFTPDQVRELDRIAIEEQGIAGYELMCRAGQFAFDAIRGRYPVAHNWLVYCGSGNNAGDGYVIGRLAIEAGLRVKVVAVSDPDKLSGDAARAWESFQAAGGQSEAFATSGDVGNRTQYDLVIDALLGTGLMRPVEGAYADAVAAIAEHTVPVVAVDIPSGLNGCTGAFRWSFAKAWATVSTVATTASCSAPGISLHSQPANRTSPLVMVLTMYNWWNYLAGANNNFCNGPKAVPFAVSAICAGYEILR